MNEQNQDFSSTPLFDVMPPTVLNPGQVGHWYDTGAAPRYKLLQNPHSFEELGR
jgi:hypothetical protein